jgi:type VII secretion integral membrane protein EccD
LAQGPAAGEPVDVCRLTVRTQLGAIEAAVPRDLTLAEFLPAVLRLTAARAGDPEALTELADRGLAGGGWVLQRLGEPPLDEEETVEALGLRHGEVLHMRPRVEQLPEIDFDDLIDGVAVNIARLPDRWRPQWTRALLLGAAGAVLAAAAVFAALASPGAGPVTAAGGAVLLLLGSAAAACRAFDDRACGIVLAAGAIALAAAAGYQAPALAPHPQSAARLLAAAAAAGAAAMFGALACGTEATLFSGIGVATAGAAVAALPSLLAGAPAAAPAAVLAAVAQLALVGVPLAAFRLARRRLDPLPTGAADLQRHIEPESAAAVQADVQVINRYMTSLTVALAALTCGAVTVLAAAPGWAPGTVAASVSVLCLLHARVLGGAWQRIAVVAAGLYGALYAGAVLVRHADSAAATGLVGAAALVALGCCAASRLAPGRRAVPYWASLANAVQWLAALVLLPSVLAATGVFSLARGHG